MEFRFSTVYVHRLHHWRRNDDSKVEVEAVQTLVAVAEVRETEDPENPISLNSGICLKS